MENGQIYGLIGNAMKEIGAIKKESHNNQQNYKYRGIDAVMNALSPVLMHNNLFLVPEVLDHKREERQTNRGGNLIYSILTMRYTMYAPDGSSVSATVIGEGMDSGDKASNKAMSVAMKYAMFQLFCIPTEEFVDPDSETPPPSVPADDNVIPIQTKEPPNKPGSFSVGTAISAWCTRWKCTLDDFLAWREAVIKNGTVPDIPKKQMRPSDFDQLIRAIEQLAGVSQ